jgi:hypothetical protein
MPNTKHENRRLTARSAPRNTLCWGYWTWDLGPAPPTTNAAGCIEGAGIVSAIGASSRETLPRETPLAARRHLARSRPVFIAARCSNKPPIRFSTVLDSYAVGPATVRHQSGQLESVRVRYPLRWNFTAPELVPTATRLTETEWTRTRSLGTGRFAPSLGEPSDGCAGRAAGRTARAPARWSLACIVPRTNSR